MFPVLAHMFLFIVIIFGGVALELVLLLSLERNWNKWAGCFGSMVFKI